MNFSETPLKGAFIIELDKREDTEVSLQGLFVKMRFRFES